MSRSLSARLRSTRPVRLRQNPERLYWCSKERILANLVFELRIVEVTEPLAPLEQRPRERPTPREKPSAQETFETLRATEGGASVIEQVPSLARPDLWDKLAYFDLTGGSGPAALFVFFWDADFDNTPNPVEVDIWNNYMLFSGVSRRIEYGAPGTTTGQISCFFAPWLFLPSGSGDYAIHVELWGYGPWQGAFDSEPEEPKVAFFIDGIPLGERVLAHDWVDTVLYVRLVDGGHRLDIRQMPGSGSFLFRSVSVWYSPVVAPPGPVA